MKQHHLEGTVIHGTLLPYDLLEAFATELEDRSVGEDNPAIKAAIIESKERLSAGRDSINHPADPNVSENISELINEIADLINEIAEDGYYFGAHEGDGSDFGYWSIEN